LRAAVRTRVARRGEPAKLAKAIGKRQSFVTEYLQEKQHANLDTTVAIAKHFRFSLRMLMGLDPYPEYDEETEALVARWRDATPEMREAVMRVLGYATAPPLATPQSAPLRAPDRRRKGRKNRSAS
jgi:hypothetical protein